MINENISPNNYSQKSSSYYYARKNSYDLLGASRDMKLLSDLRPKGKATKIYIYIYIEQRLSLLASQTQARRLKPRLSSL